MNRYFDRGSNRQYKPSLAVEAFDSDAEMLSDAINGSNALLAALESRRGPDRFPWRDRGGALNARPNPESMNTAFMVHRVSLIEMREAHADALRVARDPCPFCGIRTDIGCKHRRVA